MLENRMETKCARATVNNNGSELKRRQWTTGESREINSCRINEMGLQMEFDVK